MINSIQANGVAGYKNPVDDPFLPREIKDWRDGLFRKFRPLGSIISNHWNSVYQEQPFATRLRDANLSMHPIQDQLTRSRYKFDAVSEYVDFWEFSKLPASLNFTWDDDVIVQFCEAVSVSASRCVGKHEHGDFEKVKNYCQKLCEMYGIEYPEPASVFCDHAPSVNRVCEKGWWKRQIRKLQARRCEGVARDLQAVSKNKSSYCSEYTLNRRRRQKRRNRSILEGLLAVNEEGQEYTLADLADLGTSNPAVRRAELMVRMRGFETVAGELNHAAMFYTVTCPSRFHRFTKFKPNPNYDGSTPGQAQEWLCTIWSRFRAWLNRLDIRVYGFRVAEPHHDGCPHWHLLLFMHKNDVSRVTDKFRRYALSEDGDEPGARKHRFTPNMIDPAKGTATGYIAKYISKNIDGARIEKDLYGDDAKQAAERIEAWASTWGLRQFQQIGGPSVTVWRELRRMDSAEGLVEEAREAADSSNWAAYVMLMGGPTLPRKDYPIKPAVWHEISELTGEFLDTPETKYGDENKGRIMGLICNGIVYMSRFYRWTIGWEKPPTPAVKTSEDEYTEMLASGWGASLYGPSIGPLDLCQ